MSDRNPANIAKLRAQSEAAARAEEQQRAAAANDRLGFLDESGRRVSPTVDEVGMSPARRKKLREAARRWKPGRWRH